MSYLENLPDDVIYLIYGKKHRLEYADVMRELERTIPNYRNFYPWINNSKVRVGDGVKVNNYDQRWIQSPLYVVIWKGKRFLDLYDYNSGKKIRINYKNGDHIIRPSTIDYIIREITKQKRG